MHFWCLVGWWVDLVGLGFPDLFDSRFILCRRTMRAACLRRNVCQQCNDSIARSQFWHLNNWCFVLVYFLFTDVFCECCYWNILRLLTACVCIGVCVCVCVAPVYMYVSSVCLRGVRGSTVEQHLKFRKIQRKPIQEQELKNWEWKLRDDWKRHALPVWVLADNIEVQWEQIFDIFEPQAVSTPPLVSAPSNKDRFGIWIGWRWTGSRKKFLKNNYLMPKKKRSATDDVRLSMGAAVISSWRQLKSIELIN